MKNQDEYDILLRRAAIIRDRKIDAAKSEYGAWAEKIEELRNALKPAEDSHKNAGSNVITIHRKVFASDGNATNAQAVDVGKSSVGHGDLARVGLEFVAKRDGTFTVRDFADYAKPLIGKELATSSLNTAIKGLLKKKLVVMESKGRGRRPAVYRKAHINTLLSA